MLSLRLFAFIVQLALCILSNCFVISQQTTTLNVLMPNVAPHTKDTYLCHKFKLDQDNLYITEFHPNSSKSIAHHILLFGCEEPGEQDTWNCGEMTSSSSGSSSSEEKLPQQQYPSGPVCSNGAKQSIIYAWAMDAPKLVLPKDVSFKVGKQTPIKYLVLQVHYANVDIFKNGHTDDSGLILKAQTQPTPNTAGVYLLETGGYIKPQQEEYFETACGMSEDVVMYPFAYRTHTHKLGVVNTGYVIKTTNDVTDRDHEKEAWIELGRRSPQLPQMFYPIADAGKVTVNKGDVLAARCTMRNTKDHVVSIGPTGDDEMCNFYIMYYVKGDRILDSNVCMSYGPPFWSFASFVKEDDAGSPLDLNAIPDDISQVPREQEMELMSEMSQHNMKEMTNDENEEDEEQGQGQEEEGEEEEKLNEMLDDLIQRVKQEEEEEADGEGEEEMKEEEQTSNDSDEYETYLNKLQKENMEKKMIEKMLLKEKYKNL